MGDNVLPVHRAIERATAAGARAELLCAVLREDINFSVAVTTYDGAPIVSIRRTPPAGGASDMLLGERDQFGPDSWDYPARFSLPTHRFMLRLSASGGSVDVPILSAAAAVLLQLGWAATPGDIATVIVSEDTFSAALESVNSSEHAPRRNNEGARCMP